MTFTIEMTLGERMRYAREKAGLDQADLEPILMTTRQAISAWEHDRHRPHPLKLRAYAEAVGVPVEFFDGETRTFSMVPDGGSPLAGTSSTLHITSLTGWYPVAPQVTGLRLAA